MRIEVVRNRLYADFLMPSRLSRYRDALRRWQDRGYAIESVEGFWQTVKGGPLEPSSRHLVLRHDVDTDPRTARSMWAIDEAVGVHASYYFRLSTVDVGLMRAIAAAGSEASYHYEELATIAKRHRLRRRADAVARIGEAQDLFRSNLERLRARTGLPMRAVASHGDFANRALGVPNWVILGDPAFRESVGVELEAYDDDFARHLTSRFSDTGYPRYWVHGDPSTAVDRDDPVVYVLVHPRHWYARRLVNLRDDAGRIAESVAWRLPGSTAA